MSNSHRKDGDNKAIDLMHAIYDRRSVRDYLPAPVSSELIHILLDAAMQAPSALHEEPRAFVVIQDKTIMDRLSESCKAEFLNDKNKYASEQSKHVFEVVTQNDFNTFYNAGTLIVIYSTFPGPFVAADCWLAAENLMLAAYAKGLGSCVIGLALSALNLPEWKQELGISADMTAQVSMILGWPKGKTLEVSHKPANILAWKQGA